MKNILLAVLLLFVIALLVITIDFYRKANKFTKSYEEEKYSRMVAEESLQRNANKLAALEAQLKAANSKMSKVEDLMTQQRSTNEDLKKEYDKLNKAKSEIEDQLQSVLKDKSSQVSAPVEVPKDQAPAVVEVGK